MEIIMFGFVEKAKLYSAFLLFIGGLYLFVSADYIMESVRYFSSIILFFSSVSLFAFSKTGLLFKTFLKSVYIEYKKIVFPTRKEATQITFLVFVFILVLSIYLWVIDKFIELFLYHTFLA